MRVHSLEKIKKLKKCRKMGYSIPQLMRKFSVPKSTVWYHVHNIKVPKKHRVAIRKRQGGGKAKNERNWKKANKEARDRMKTINKKDTMIVALTALYWGEGTKRGAFVFTNTDEDIIKVFLKCLREGFGVKDEDITAMVRIGSNMDPRYSSDYWQKTTRLPPENIILNRNKKQNKSRFKYGICRIRLKRGSYMLKLAKTLTKELTFKVNNS